MKNGEQFMSKQQVFSSIFDNDTSFKKFDTEKPMITLVEPRYIVGMAEVLTFGAKKYAIDNWKQATADDIRRIKDSLLRHTLAYTSGEILDNETGLSHAYSIGCNAMFLDYLLSKGITNES